MIKKKILAWCDAPIISTGFGVVSMNLLSELHKDFDLSIVGINYMGFDRYDPTKWFIYPVQAGQDPLGVEVLKRVLPKEKPEIIFLFQDIFHISMLLPMIKNLSPESKIVTYFPVDGGPLCKDWENIFSLVDYNITYSEFAKNTIKESYPTIDIDSIDHMYHGVSDVFKKLSDNKIRVLKAENKVLNKFMAVNINRYQPRKNIHATLRAWSLFSKGYKLCSCGNAYPKYLQYCDANRCDANSVTDVTDPKLDVCLYMHMRLAERSNGPGPANILSNVAALAGFTQHDVNRGLLKLQGRDIYTDPYTTEEVNEIYNMADINISTTVGEGCGLSLIESAASGTTSIAPNNSAVPEMLEGHGILVDNVPNGMFSQPFDNSFRRPQVDTLKFVHALEEQYKLWKANGKKKVINQAAIDIVKRKFQWDDKRDQLHKIFHDLLN